MFCADCWTLLRRWAACSIGLVFMLCAGFALAEEGADPPGRVGWLADFQGGVQIWSAEDNAWAPAQINMPLTTGSALSTPAGGRAEMRIGSTAVRIGADTQANFHQLDDEGVAIDIPQGAVRARLRNFTSEDRFALSAGGIRFEARDAADFRVDSDPNAQRATLSVFSGRVQVLGADETIILSGGQQTQIDFASQRVTSLTELDRDAFDDWFDARERGTVQAEALRYVSPEMTGVEALAGQGVWATDVSYGAIWYPTVAVGWVPYRYGRWGWVAPWGWTWIDDARWGFVTCHYGRWAHVGNRWGWVPGRRIARPIYAPALVGFYGGGPQVGVRVRSGPAVGWFPLGPHEPYRPTYFTSQTYLRQVNVTHVTNVAHLNSPPPYRYARRPDAATLVPRGAFVGARPVNPAAMRVDPDQLRQAPIADRPSLPPPAFRGQPGAQPPRWQPRQFQPPRDAGRPQMPEGPRPADRGIPRGQAEQPGFQRPLPPAQPVSPAERPIRTPANPDFAPANPRFAPGNPRFAPGNPRFAPGNPNFAPANPDFVPGRPGATPQPARPQGPGLYRPPQAPGNVTPLPQRPAEPIRTPPPTRFQPPARPLPGGGQPGQFRPQPQPRSMPAPVSPGVDRPAGFQRAPAPQRQIQPMRPAPQGGARPAIRGGGRGPGQ